MRPWRSDTWEERYRCRSGLRFKTKGVEDAVLDTAGDGRVYGGVYGVVNAFGFVDGAGCCGWWGFGVPGFWPWGVGVS